MSIPTFGAPAVTTEEGDNFDMRAAIGHTLIVKPRSFNPSVITANAPNGTPSVRCDIADLDSTDPAGPVFRGIPLFTGALVDATRPAVDSGEVLLVRVEMRQSRNGRTYPSFVAANTDQQAVARAQQFYGQFGDPFAPQFAAPPAPAPAAPQQQYAQPQQGYGQQPQYQQAPAPVQQQYAPAPQQAPQPQYQQPQQPQYAPAPQQAPVQQQMDPWKTDGSAIPPY